MLEWNLGPSPSLTWQSLSAEHEDAFRLASQPGRDVYSWVTSSWDQLLEEGLNAEKVGASATIAGSARVINLSYKINEEIRKLVDSGRIERRQALDLTLACHAYYSHRVIGTSLHKLVTVTQPPELTRDRFQAGVMPLIVSSRERENKRLKRGGCSAKVTGDANGHFLITVDYGLLSALQDVHLICWDVFNNRAAADPKQFVRDYCERFVALDSSDLPPLPPKYIPKSIDNLHGTGFLGLLTKQFVLAHELGHVIRFRRLARKDLPGEEFESEFEADQAGWRLHLTASTLLKPPYNRLCREGLVRTVADARRWTEQRVRESLTPDLVIRSIVEKVPLQSLLPARQLFGLSNEDVDDATAVEFWSFAAPFLVFRFFECWEFAHERAGRALLGTHPTSKDRATHLLGSCPDATRAVVEGHVLPLLDRVFPSTPW